MRTIFSLACLWFALSSHAQETIKDAIIYLDQACLMGEEEIILIDSLFDQQISAHDLLSHERDRIKTILTKLNRCKTRLIESLDNADTCAFVASEKEQHESICALNHIGTACDWLIRGAGVIWSLEMFYGHIIG
jgi:hypothetical protein